MCAVVLFFLMVYMYVQQNLQLTSQKDRSCYNIPAFRSNCATPVSEQPAAMSGHLQWDAAVIFLQLPSGTGASGWRHDMRGYAMRGLMVVLLQIHLRPKLVNLYTSALASDLSSTICPTDMKGSGVNERFHTRYTNIPHITCTTTTNHPWAIVGAKLRSLHTVWGILSLNYIYMHFEQNRFCRMSNFKAVLFSFNKAQTISTDWFIDVVTQSSDLMTHVVLLQSENRLAMGLW